MTTTQLGNAQVIGETIRAARVAHGLTKAQAARVAGVSRRTWHEIEEGQRATTTAETLACFDAALGFAEGTLYAMTSRSASVQIEALRARAIDLVRLMSSDELEVFVESHGRATVAAVLRQLEADVEALKRERAADRRSTA